MASLSQPDFVNIMEGGNGSSYNLPVKPLPSELEILQKQHEEKTVKIQDLKRQIQALKLRLENRKTKKDISNGRREAIDNLSKKYNILREEYDALLSQRSRIQPPLIKFNNLTTRNKNELNQGKC